MEGINVIFCGSDVKNTGVCECFFDPKLITGGLLVPKDKVFTATELLDVNIQATLEAAVAEDSKGQRSFPLPSFNNITDNSAEDTVQTFGYGGQETVVEGNYDWLLAYRKGGLNLSNAMRSFSGLIGKYRLILFENQNTLIGTSRKDANGDWGVGGIPLEDLKGMKFKVADGTNLAGYGTKVSFKPEYINEAIAFKKVDKATYLLSELEGLEDIKLTLEDVNEAETEVTVSATSACGSTNMYDDNADALAEATAWVYKRADGTEVVISVVKDDALEAWVITPTGGVLDGDTITLAAVSVLAAAPISIPNVEAANTLTVELGS